ncbi:hypothetical protein HCH_02576 [Hahella chejuensis KCTC 2396]|uniref:Uncharacterized protein n=1 Tax=Hahella chejuensis (strain KCTC 2396) TaxID=349521 RepID=Q2SIZ8_HAHCH|nr:hypothetical protein [Hahella chejuensis]ABC29376.1 hypothetical protein HCH_02576 [Hahella chejuensis KCTC 2396]
MDKAVYFISGHLDLTPQEFEQHYAPAIDQALENQASFVIGDARGADKLAQDYLYGKSNAVTVYHMFDTPRNNPGFPTRSGFTSDNQRDKQMTADSTCDIAWVRPGREKSGTARNLARRQCR